MLPSPELVAVPDYPVAAGQRVSLHCTSVTTTSSVTWSWKRLENQNWTVVESGRDLILTQPEQSGLYRCLVRTGFSQERASPPHAVFIVSMHANGLSSVLICCISKPFIYEYTIQYNTSSQAGLSYMSRLCKFLKRKKRVARSITSTKKLLKDDAKHTNKTIRGSNQMRFTCFLLV